MKKKRRHLTGTAYEEGIPPVVFAVKRILSDRALIRRRRRSLTLLPTCGVLLADPRVTVNDRIGQLAGDFAYNYEAPLNDCPRHVDL